MGPAVERNCWAHPGELKCFLAPGIDSAALNDPQGC
jgi:hypothetical protein